MNPTQKLKLQQLLKNNKYWPLLIVCADIQKSDDTSIIPATISERDLHTDMLVIKPYLLIEGLDAISKQEQEKFITLLKDRRTGLRKLPDNVQILIPVKAKENLSQKILDLVLIWNGASDV